MLYFIKYCVNFSSLITTNYRGPRSKLLLAKDSLQKKNESEVILDFVILAQKGSKIEPQKKVNFWVFVKHPAVYRTGVSRRRVCGCGCWRK